MRDLLRLCAAGDHLVPNHRVNIAVLAATVVLRELRHKNLVETRLPGNPGQLPDEVVRAVARLAETERLAPRLEAARRLEEGLQRLRVVRKIDEHLEVVDDVEITPAGICIL